MAFTQSSRDALMLRTKRVTFEVKLRTEHPESNTWQTYELMKDGFRLTLEAGLPARLVLDPVPPGTGLGSETDPANRWQLFAHVELWCNIYLDDINYESERLFKGVITEILPRDGRKRAVALDRMHVLSRTVCEVLREADQVAIPDGSPIVSVPNFGSLTYGLDQSSTPDGFSPGGARRAWQPGDIRVYDDSSDPVPPGDYVVYPDTGVVRFNSTPSGSFTISRVRCYIEGSNDIADIIVDALSYPSESGGPGIQPGEIGISALGLDLNLVRWEETSGSVQDFFTLLRRSLPSNATFYYDSDDGKFKLEQVVQSETPELSLINPIRIESPRNTHAVFTRVLVHGESPRPIPLTENATLTDMQLGVGDVFKWNGNKKEFGVGSISLVADGNPDSGFGRHNFPGAPYDWRDFVKIDLGEPAPGKFYIISRIDIVAANSHNANSQSSSNLKFLYGIELLGSRDDIEYIRLFPGAEFYMKALEVRVIEGLTFDRFRYLLVRIKPAKDGISNESDPGLSLNEIRVWGSRQFIVEANAQNSDPLGDFYYPDLLEKTASIGHLTYIEEVGNTFDEYASESRAGTLLNEFIRSFQRVEYSAVVDPMIELYSTVQAADSLSNLNTSILVERVVIEGNKTLISGTDYLSDPLS